MDITDYKLHRLYPEWIKTVCLDPEQDNEDDFLEWVMQYELDSDWQ